MASTLPPPLPPARPRGKPSPPPTSTSPLAQLRSLLRSAPPLAALAALALTLGIAKSVLPYLLRLAGSSTRTLAAYVVPFALVYASPLPCLLASGKGTAEGGRQTQGVALGLWVAAAAAHVGTLCNVMGRGAFGWLVVYLAFALMGVQWTALEAIVGTQALARVFEWEEGSTQEKGRGEDAVVAEAAETTPPAAATAATTSAYTQRTAPALAPAKDAYIHQTTTTPTRTSTVTHAPMPTADAIPPAHVPAAEHIAELQQ